MGKRQRRGREALRYTQVSCDVTDEKEDKAEDEKAETNSVGTNKTQID